MPNVHALSDVRMCVVFVSINGDLTHTCIGLFVSLLPYTVYTNSDEMLSLYVKCCCEIMLLLNFNYVCNKINDDPCAKPVIVCLHVQLQIVCFFTT